MQTPVQIYFRRIALIVCSFMVVYAGVYFSLGAGLTALVLFLDGLLMTPIVLMLDRKGFADSARYLFIAGCTLAVCATPIGIPHATNAEYYIFPGLLASFIVFDWSQKKQISFSFGFMLSGWLLIESKWHADLPPPWVPSEFPELLFRRLNFLGAAALFAILIVLHSRRLLFLRKAAVQDLEQINTEIVRNERFLNDVLGALPNLVAYISPDYRYQYANQKFEAWYNLKSEEILGLTISEVLGEATFQNLRPKIDQALKGERQDFEMQIHPARAKSKVIRAFHVPDITKSESGQTFVNGIYVIVSDITAESLALEQVAKSAQETRERKLFLEAVLNNMPSMVFVKDFTKDMQFTLLNRAGENFLSTTSAEFIGKDDFDFFPKDKAFEIRQTDLKIFAEKKAVILEREATLNTKLGERILTTHKIPTFDQNGNPHLLIGIANDITDELNAKETIERERLKGIQNAKLATVGEMAAGVAHEINNPLAIVAGTLDLMLRDLAAPDKLKVRIDSIRKSVARISKIINGLKKFSRSAELTTKKNESLKTLLEEAVALTELKATRNAVQVTCQCEPGLQIHCNEIEMGQVLINLINNAIDAICSKAEIAEKWVKLSGFAKGNAIAIQIEDAGAGIPKDIQQKLFLPFFTTKPVGEGTGLGLSIVRGILAESGATIEILNDNPHTCFEILFPTRGEIADGNPSRIH